MPHMALPPIGYRFGRAGELPSFANCEHKPYSKERLSPVATAACRKRLEQQALYVDGYEAQFTKRYAIDGNCVRKPGVLRALPPIRGQRGRCAQGSTELKFETTLAAQELPRAGASSVARVYADVTTSPHPYGGGGGTLPVRWNYRARSRSSRIRSSGASCSPW